MHLKQKDEKIFTEKILLISHRSMTKMTSECIVIPSIETRREDDRYFLIPHCLLPAIPNLYIQNSLPTYISGSKIIFLP